TGWGKGLAASVSFGGSAFQSAPNGFVAGVGDVDADGLADTLLGSTSGRAYLILGNKSLATQWSIQAALSGVAAAASAPYAPGPRDRSSLRSVAAGPGGGVSVGASGGGSAASAAGQPSGPLSWLGRLLGRGQTPGAHPAQGVGGMLRYVDDDYCASCANDGHS